jgi:hypothetical protein
MCIRDRLNTLAKKYNGSIFNVEHIYIVGGATTVGWDAGNAIELTKGTGDQANVFTFDGSLTVNAAGSDRNKFKFLLQRDWGPASFHAQVENESITAAQNFTNRISDDYKWTVDADKQGRYVIKLDALQETIQATYYPVTTGIVDTELNIKVFAANGSIRVTSENELAKSVEVFAMDGRRVAQKTFDSNIEINLPNGIYTVRVKGGGADLITRKVSVIK